MRRECSSSSRFVSYNFSQKTEIFFSAYSSFSNLNSWHNEYADWLAKVQWMMTHIESDQMKRAPEECPKEENDEKYSIRKSFQFVQHTNNEFIWICFFFFLQFHLKMKIDWIGACRVIFISFIYTWMNQINMKWYKPKQKKCSQMMNSVPSHNTLFKDFWWNESHIKSL